MNFRSVILITFFCIAYLGLEAQKVKYKDLIILLNSKQYDQAEPFLKKYLKDHDDNPNAYLFMGIIFHEKAAKEDVLKETDLIMQHADSALINYAIASKTIDEREVRRNDEYYEAYNRRDLRTGEFGVKLSDVKLDIEKRIQFLKDRKDNVKKLRENYQSSTKLYERCQEQFKEIKGSLTEQRFYLLSDEKTVEKLKVLIATYDSAISFFDTYKSISKLIGKTGYNQVINLLPIKSFAKDGITQADFSKDDLKLWDYKSWATGAIATVEEDITPLRAELLKIDVELNQLGNKLKKDSVSVKKNANESLSTIFVTRIKKYDEDPFPLAIFKLKISELEYVSDLVVNKKRKDSSDVNYTLSLAKSELEAAKKIDSISTNLLQKDTEKELICYADFVTKSYGNIDVVKSLINSLKEYAVHQIEFKESEVKIKEKALDWIVIGSDSIPLTEQGSSASKSHKLLLIKPNILSVGLSFGADSIATGYFATITPSRIPDVHVSFQVDKNNFRRKNLSSLKALSVDDGKGQIYYSIIYSIEKVNNKYPISLAKIYRSDGLAWNANYVLDFLPEELLFSNETGAASIKSTLPTGEIKTVVFDKNGKLIK